MKPKQWVVQMKPYAQKMIEMMDATGPEADKAYEDWCTQADALHDECYEIVKMRMKGFEPNPDRYFSSIAGIKRLTSAISEASVKYRQVYVSLSQELQGAEPPYPMSPAAMFLPTVFALQKAVDETKFQMHVLQELLSQVKGMAKSLLFEDEPFVKATLRYCEIIISDKKQTQYINDTLELSQLMIDVQKTLENSKGISVMSVLSRNPHALALARRINSYMRET